ncbi:MAG: hypothetical protein LUE20_09250 [Oscillospiraceae bacterium]|nr:hypothetical protein [Oscillospiraceae bacterium]
MTSKIILERIISVTLILTVAVSLTGCSLFDTITAYGLYSRAVTQLEKAGGYEADCIMSIAFDILGETVSSETVMNIKENSTGTQIVTEMDDETITTTYVDDKVYVEYGDSLIYYTVVDLSSIESIGDVNLPELAKEVFDNISVIKNDDGTKQISIVLESENADSILGSFVSGLSDLTFNDIVYTMLFDKNNNLSMMTLICSASIDVLGYTMTGYVTAEYTFIDFGTAPEFELGYDESEYEDGGEYSG